MAHNDHPSENKVRIGRDLTVLAEDLLPRRSASPLARGIIARDFVDYLSEHGGDDDDLDDAISVAESFFSGAAALPPLAMARSRSIELPTPNLFLRPSGVVYGSVTRAGLPPQMDGADDPVPSERELVEARLAEESLLRDNHLLPPKHGAPDPEEGLWWRVYRRVFSTKVRYSSNNNYNSTKGTTYTETTPLLRSYHQVDVGEDDEDDDAHAEQEEQAAELAHDVAWGSALAADQIQTTWQREAKTLFQYSRSLILTFLLHYSVQIVSIFTIGRFGKLELGAVSLATMTANITCYAPIQGLATSLDTLCAQAYGSGQKKLVGLQLQRMTYLIWLLLLPPIWLLWWHADVLLAALLPDTEPQTAQLAGQYLRVLILGTPGYAAFETGKRFVMAQGLFHATTLVLLLGAPLNLVLNWFLVWRLDLGFLGAGLTIVCVQTLLPGLLLGYVVLVEGRECWGGLRTAHALRNWGPMLRLALPGLVMLEAQFLAFEVLALVSAQFGGAYLAAQSVIITITTTTFQLPFPLSIAASTRVANLVGAGLVDAARLSAKVSLVAAVLVGLFNLTLLTTFRAAIPGLFTNDVEVISLVSAVLPICGALQVVDAIAAMSHGLLRGIGRQSIGGYTNLFSYYVIALPLAFALAFGLGWKLQGLWTGCTIGLGVVGVIELVYLVHADWDQAVQDAERRNAYG